MKVRSKLYLLLRMKWQTYLPSTSAHESWEGRIKSVFYSTFLFFFMFGAYLFFYRAFSYLSDQPQIGTALMNRILSIGFLTFFSLLFISNIITALSTLYRSTEISYLLTTPAPVIDVYVLKSIENIFFSSWAILILGSPIVIAYGMALGAPFFFYPLVFITMLIFIVIPASLGISLTVLFSRFFAKLRLRQVFLFSVFMFLSLLLIFLNFIRPKVIILEETEDLSQVNQFLSDLPASSSYLSPGTWLTNIFNQAIALDMAEVLFYLLVLTSTAMMSFQIAYWIGEKFYHHSWTETQVSNELRARELAKRRKIIGTEIRK